MITPELLEFIRKQSASGITREVITTTLVDSGWDAANVEEAFHTIEKNEVQSWIGVRPTIEQVLPQKAVSFWKKRWVRVLLWIFGGVFALALILVLIPVVLGLIVRDTPVAHDTDLELSHVDIQESENAFEDLVALEPPSQLHKAKKGDTPFRNIGDVESLHNSSAKAATQFADSVFMENLLKENSAAFGRFDAAAKKPYFQEPYTSDPTLVKSNQLLPLMSTWRQAARLEGVRAEYLALIGRHDDAMRVAMNDVLVGQLILESKQPMLIAYLVGLAIKGIGLDTLERIVASSTITGAESKSYNDILEQAKLNTSRGLAGAFKVEYLNMKLITLEVVGGKSGNIGEYGDVPSPLINSYYFQKNKTLDIFADNYRRLMANSLLSCSQKPTEGDWERYALLRIEPWRIYFENNAIGKILNTVIGASFTTVFSKRCSDLSHVSAVQLYIALNAYRNEHGTLPATLDLLVPVYLSKVPEDPFDGMPMKYDATRKIIYSIGTDRVDDKGSGGLSKTAVSADWYGMKDQVLLIPF